MWKTIAETQVPAIRAGVDLTRVSTEDLEKYKDLINRGEFEIQDSLPTAIAKHYALSLAAWAFVIALVYGAGLSIGWVHRGFKRQT